MHGGGNLCGNTSVVFKEEIRTKLISVAFIRSPSERTGFNVKKTNKSIVMENLLVDMRIYISNESSRKQYNKY